MVHPKLRTDLKYDRHDDGVRAITFVKDPIRSVFYEWRDLQLTLATLFDGKRSVEDVVQVLAAEYDVQVATTRVHSFAAFLEQRLLLEVTCYESSPRGTRAEVRRVLRRQGIVLRRDPRTGGRRRAELGPDSFETGVRELERGRCTQAARVFAAILEIDPENRRARAIYDAIHLAFFRQFRELPSYMRMVHLWNPDRFLERLDACVGKVLFSRWGMLLFTLSVLSAAALAPDVKPLAAASIGWTGVLLATGVIGLSTLFLHELGHGLACKHYGGKVESMGVMLFYGVIPGAYCDVTEVHKLRKRWHKVVVYLAGVLIEIPVLCLWLWCYHLSAEWLVLHHAILVWLAYDVYIVMRNVIPFVRGYDGYHALTNYLDLPDLAAQAFALLRGLLAQRIFGVPAARMQGPRPANERVAARQRRILLTFGLASAVYHVVFFYGIWFRFLFPLVVKYLQTPGLILAIAYAYRVVGSKVLRGARDFALFLVRERRRIFTMRRSLAFAVVLSALGGLLATPYRSWADAEFVVRPRLVALVRATEPGLVASVAVREGAIVRRGDVLARLDDAELVLRERTLDQQLVVASQELGALERGPRREEVTLYRARVQRAEESSSLSWRSRVRTERLFGLGVLSAGQLEQVASAADGSANEAAVARSALVLARARGRPQELAAARARLSGLRREREHVSERRRRTILRSPANGVVVSGRLDELAYKRLEGGAVLCEIHDRTAVYGELSLAKSELLTELSIGGQLALRAVGDPHRLVRSEIAQIEPGAHGREQAVVARSEELSDPGWPAGLSGHARVYFEPRSIAFNWFGGRLLQLVDYTLWSQVH